METQSKAGTKHKPPSERVGGRVSPTVKKALRRMAKTQGKSESNLIADMVTERVTYTEELSRLQEEIKRRLAEMDLRIEGIEAVVQQNTEAFIAWQDVMKELTDAIATQIQMAA